MNILNRRKCSSSPPSIRLESCIATSHSLNTDTSCAMLMWHRIRHARTNARGLLPLAGWMALRIVEPRLLSTIFIPRPSRRSGGRTDLVACCPNHPTMVGPLKLQPVSALTFNRFLRRRSLAQGIASSGSGIVGVIYAVATTPMIENISLPWALRITGETLFQQ